MSLRSKLIRLPAGAYEDEIREFGKQMLRELQDHEHIGHWPSWKPTTEELRLEMSKYFIWFQEAVKRGDRQRAGELMADIGNLAMKGFSIYGKRN